MTGSFDDIDNGLLVDIICSAVENGDFCICLFCGDLYLVVYNI